MSTVGAARYTMAPEVSLATTTHEGNRPLGRARRRWDDNIKKDIQEVRSGYKPD